MATSTAGFRPLLLQQLRSALLTRRTTPAVSLIPMRYKQMKVRRAKAPSTSRDKGKWVPRVKYVKVVEKNLLSQLNPNWVNKKPVDDVWIRSFYPRQSFSFEECVERHREYADPCILDNMNGMVYAEMQLDMTTKKKTKFLKNFKSILLPPHQFDDGVVKRCAVFCKEESDQELAKELGAVVVGGTDLVKQLLDGTVTKDEFDFTLCTPDMLVDLFPIRTMIKDMFPHKLKGNLNSSVTTMMNMHTNGVSFSSTKESDAIGKLQIPLGTLNMTTDQLRENFLMFVESVSNERPSKLGQFITKLMLIAPPSSEQFLVKTEDYIQEPEDVDSDEELEATSKQ